MALVKILKIDGDGVPIENADADDILFNSFTAGSGGPVLSPTGLNLADKDITATKDILFTNPSTGALYQTAGALTIDNIMGKDRDNAMAITSSILFGLIGNQGVDVDSFKVPHMSVAPTVAPSVNADPGFIVSYGGSLFMWDGSAWNDLGVSDSANQVLNSYIADETLLANDMLYISADNNVSKALADNTSKSYAIGFAKAAAADTAPVDVVSEGVLGGFSTLTAGSRYYLSDSVAGAITGTIPSGSGKTIVQAGYAKNSTTLHIHIEQMGRRA